MAIFGYHRTSTKEQHLDRGILEIERFCETRSMRLEKIFTDQKSGKNFQRPQYELLVEYTLRKEDILILTELDRLGRNKRDILNQLQLLKEKGVWVMVLELPMTLMEQKSMENKMAKMMMETISNMMIELYASMAEAEMEKKEKRQREGIEAKKLRGEWDEYGRPRIMNPKQFKTLYHKLASEEKTVEGIRERMGMSKSTFYRYRRTCLCD